MNRRVHRLVALTAFVSSLAGCATSIDYSKYESQECSYVAEAVSKPSDTGLAVILAPSSTFSSLDQFFSGAGGVLGQEFGSTTTFSTYVVGETTQLVSQTYVDNSESVFGSNAKKAIDGAVAQALDSAQCFVDAGLQTGEQDLLGALTLASSSFEQASDMASKTIYVYSNGLQTAGSLKLQESFSKNGEEISATLESEGALPQLDNVTVVFYGLGQVSGEQPAFSSKSGNHLEEIWKSIVERGGGLFVNGGPVSLGNGNPSAPQMSLVQPLQSKPIVSGCKATLTDENLSFQANSSEFLDAELARLSISQVASSFLSQKCRGSVKVTGYTTNYGDETLQNSLSESRAANVANALTDYLPNVEIEVFGNGYDGSGELDQSNRRVEIEVSGR